MKKVYFLLFACILAVTAHANTTENSMRKSTEVLSMQASQPSVRMKKSWIELNVMHDGVKGTMIHVNMEADGYKGANMQLISFLDSPKGESVKDTNGKYCNTQGYVCTWADLNNLPYDQCVWDDLKLFLPNSEIHPKPGKHEYFLHTFLIKDGKSLGDIWSGSFNMTGAEQQSNSSKQQSSNGNGNRKQVSSGNKIVKGQGFIGNGLDIHVMPPETGSAITRNTRILYFCNVACSPVKVRMSYYEPEVSNPNNPFIVNIANQLRGYCFNIEFPGSNNIHLGGIADWTFENGDYTFKDKNGIILRFAPDLSYVKMSGGGLAEMKYQYRIPESDYNKFAQLQRNFLDLAARHQAVQQLYDSNSSSSSSSSSNRTSSGKSQEHYKGIRVKKYAPNYVFPAEEVWCDECKAYDFRHSHVWKK